MHLGFDCHVGCIQRIHGYNMWKPTFEGSVITDVVQRLESVCVCWGTGEGKEGWGAVLYSSYV